MKKVTITVTIHELGTLLYLVQARLEFLSGLEKPPAQKIASLQLLQANILKAMLK